MVGSQYKWMAVLTHDEKLKTTLLNISIKQKARTHFFKFIEQLNDFIFSYLSLENKLPQIIVVDSFFLPDKVVKMTIVGLLKIIKEVNETYLELTKSDVTYKPLIVVTNASKNIVDEFEKEACVQIRHGHSLILSSHFGSSSPKLHCKYCQKFDQDESSSDTDNQNKDISIIFMNSSNEVSSLLKNVNFATFKSFGLIRADNKTQDTAPEIVSITFIINGGLLSIDDRFVSFKKHKMAITKIEHKILVKLIEATENDTTVSPEDISVLVWGDPLHVKRLWVHLTKLRQKLSDLEIIIERFKSGYRLRL